MSDGILITNGADIDYAGPLDFVLDSRLKGGLKIAQKLFLTPENDLQYDSVNNYWYGQKAHGLGYVPATICFQDGFFGSGWQNNAIISAPSANTDEQNVYIQTGSSSQLCIIIFGEKVSDT